MKPASAARPETLEPDLALAHPGRDKQGAGCVGEAGGLRVEVECLVICRGSSCEVLRLLRQPGEGSSRSRQRFSADPIAVRQLSRLSIAGGISETLCLRERIGPAIDVLETVIPTSGTGNSEFMIVQLTSNGSIDPTFGTSGAQFIPFGTTSSPDTNTSA